MRNTSRAKRFTVISAVAVAGLTVTGAAVGQAKTGHDWAASATGAYEGTVAGVRTPFDGNIRNNSLAVSPDERTAVATNSETDRLVVIDLRSGRKVREITGYASPRNILFDPDGAGFTLSDSTLGVVDKISLSTGRVTTRLPLGAGVFGTAATKDGRKLYANNQASGTVTVVDLAANRPLAVITGFAQPRQGVKLSPAEDLLYVTNFQGDRITKVDVATNRPVAEIGGFNRVRGLSISGDGKLLYAANSGDNTVSVVDTASGATVRRVPVGQEPYGAALSPDEKVLLSGDLGSNTLTAVDPATGAVIGVVTGVTGPRQAISYSTDSKTAWVLNADLTVAEVDVARLTVSRTLGGR